MAWSPPTVMHWSSSTARPTSSRSPTDFIELAEEIVDAAEQSKAADADALKSVTTAEGRTVDEAVEAVASVIGEKIDLGRVAYFDGTTATYMHDASADLPPAVGVLVEFEGDRRRRPSRGHADRRDAPAIRHP